MYSGGGPVSLDVQAPHPLMYSGGGPVSLVQGWWPHVCRCTGVVAPRLLMYRGGGPVSPELGVPAQRQLAARRDVPHQPGQELSKRSVGASQQLPTHPSVMESNSKAEDLLTQRDAP